LHDPLFSRSLGKLIEEMLKTNEGKNTLNNYLIWQIIKNFDMALSKKYRDVDQVLQKVLHGTEVHEQRWRTCVTDVDNAVGFAVGVMFVNETFDGEAKPEADRMIRQITKAFRQVSPRRGEQCNKYNALPCNIMQGLVEADWMDKDTRKNAEEKADKITNMVGYPDYIMNNTALEEKYADLEVVEGEYFQNSVRFNKVRRRRLGVERVKRQRVTPCAETLWIGARSQRVQRVSGRSV
jgi:endothelin-converting enzyme